MRRLAITVALILAGVLAGIRLAPSDPARWHTDPALAQPGPGRFVVCGGGDLPAVPAGPDTLARLAAIAAATPRTKLLAGSVEAGRITWITRSAVFGFPDYSTAGLTEGPGGPELCLYARLRFGRDDFGVNGARLRGWLAALDRAGG